MRSRDTIFPKDYLSQFNIVEFGMTSELEASTFNGYQDWIYKKLHFPLTYLEGERKNKRRDLKNYWSDCESAIVFLFSYHQAHQDLQQLYLNEEKWNGLKLASYTLGFDGLDYHEVIKIHLNKIGAYLQSKHQGLEFKLAFDTHPVLDRDLAYRSGLGWFGKNSMLINRKHGSFHIIGSLLLNKNLIEPEFEMKTDSDHCGQCNRCADACPTQAIDPETRTIIAKDCISTFTIEQFKLDSIPSEKIDLTSGTIFGCDICQDVCPWNKRLDRMIVQDQNKEKSDSRQFIEDFFLFQEKNQLHIKLESMTEGEFKRLFLNTSFHRSGRRGVLKNLKLLLKQLFVL